MGYAPQPSTSTGVAENGASAPGSGSVASILLAATFLLASCGPRKAETLPVPSLGTEVIKLKVAYVVNPRFPAMTKEQLKLMLAVARRAVKENFGKDVEFLEGEEYSLQALFDRVRMKDRSELNELIYDFKSGSGDQALLNGKFSEGLQRSRDSLEAMISYAKPHLLVPMANTSAEGLAAALTATLLTRLDALKSQRLPDGSNLMDRSPNNEFVYWDHIGWLSFPYDVVITNQLIASVEYVAPSVHSAIRGGITNGLTTRNRLARYGTSTIVSTYPFIGEDGVTRGLRGNESYSRTDSARFAGFLLVHEIGHQLFHLGHPYGRRSCVMNPTEMLHFRSWVEGFSPEDCPLADSGAMKPGFEKFPRGG